MIQSLFQRRSPKQPNYTPVELKPSYRVPLGLLAIALPLGYGSWILGIACGLLGLLLLFQAKTIRFCFNPTAFELYRGSTCFRSFPYENWSNWRIFWPSVPILFYFREINSIHFLPIVFDPVALQACLEERCPRQD